VRLGERFSVHISVVKKAILICRFGWQTSSLYAYNGAQEYWDGRDWWWVGMGRERCGCIRVCAAVCNIYSRRCEYELWVRNQTSFFSSI